MSKKYQRIIDLLDESMKNEESWRKTWQSQSRLHCNWISKRPYSGTNQLMAMVSAFKNEYKSPYWLTAKQIIDLGGNFKGQKATPAIFFGDGVDKDDSEKTYKFTRVYNLFNIEQTGIEVPPIEVRPTKLENPYELGDAIGVKVQSSQEHNPCYSPVTDTIKMPTPGQFESDDAHQSTFYHECAHATGHKSRLDRPLTGMFGSEDYAKEELVAELTSVFLCAELGVKYDIQQHASYLKSWQKAIKTDANYLLKAATAARKASAFCIDQLNLVRKYEDVA